MIRAALILSALTGPANALTHGFCWRGDNGYRIEGFLSYPDGATGIITEDDVTGFGITGWQDETYLGQWSLKDLKEDTSWTLRFDTDALAFPMGGIMAENSYQEWNADGFAENCGNPGFGFNGGNRAQDVCVNGVFIDESGVPPETPLRIAPDAGNPCGPLPMSALPHLRRFG